MQTCCALEAAAQGIVKKKKKNNSKRDEECDCKTFINVKEVIEVNLSATPGIKRTENDR